VPPQAMRIFKDLDTDERVKKGEKREKADASSFPECFREKLSKS
jgi:hypothetical protein